MKYPRRTVPSEAFLAPANRIQISAFCPLYQVPYSLCDLEGYPTSRPASAGVLQGLSSSLRRVGAPRSPLQRVSVGVAFSGGARYDVAITPPALGRWARSRSQPSRALSCHMRTRFAAHTT